MTLGDAASTTNAIDENRLLKKMLLNLVEEVEEIKSHQTPINLPAGGAYGYQYPPPNAYGPWNRDNQLAYAGPQYV